MPLYDYRCESGHKYELRQPFGSPAEHPCQKCGKPARRVLHARPLLFKGSGFYSTDSRSGGGRRRASSSANGESAKSTAKADASATKAAGKTADVSSSASSD